MKGTVVYPLRFNKSAWELLSQLRKDTKSDTMADTIRKAIQVYAQVVEEEKKGNSVVGVPKDKIKTIICEE